MDLSDHDFNVPIETFHGIVRASSDMQKKGKPEPTFFSD